MISYVIPTRNRHERLGRTLDAIDALYADHPPLRRAAEVIVVDNASDEPVQRGRRPNAVDTRIIRLDDNRSAAARNIGARAARHDWLVMLDDDSHPLDLAIHRLTLAAPAGVGALGAEILLPGGGHEAGGLPEVFIGCGVAIRRDLFNALGGYDESFHYYAEEYDLAARLLLGGSSVVHHPGGRVVHHNVSAGRDMNAILRNLIRNNVWINARYTPDEQVTARHDELVVRYRAIAEKENALEGFELGLREAEATLDDQARTPMPCELDDRFTGLAAARAQLRRSLAGVRTGSLIQAGKHRWCVERAARELGVELRDDAGAGGARIIATMSPGPILDALRAGGGGAVHAPYLMRGLGVVAVPEAA